MISLVTIRECKITASGVPLKSVSPVADQFVAVRAHPAGLERVRLFAELMRRGEPFPPIRADGMFRGSDGCHRTAGERAAGRVGLSKFRSEIGLRQFMQTFKKKRWLAGSIALHRAHYAQLPCDSSGVCIA